MKRNLALITAAIFLFGSATVATAQSSSTPASSQTPATTESKRTPGINERQQNQKRRIKQGVKSGELTKEETQALKAEEKAIQEEKKEYKSDGTVTRDERKDLHQDLNAASKDIYSQKHDDDKNARTPGVNQRQQNQKRRIRQGVESGELTRHETQRLVAEQKDIRQDERAAKSDGKVTTAERKDLRKEQNKASKDIYKQKHDAQKRPKAKR